MNIKRIVFIIVLILSVLSILFISFQNKAVKIENLAVISTQPKNNALLVPEKSEVVFVLNRKVEESDNSKLKIKISPEINVSTVYQDNKVRISPENSFSLNTQYNLELLYNEKIISLLTFKTTSFTPEQIREEGSKQTQGDIDFNDAYVKFYQDNPWYLKMPIEKSKYTIVYDFDALEFRIHLKQVITSESEIEQLTKLALEDIKKIGFTKLIKYRVVKFGDNF